MPGWIQALKDLVEFCLVVGIPFYIPMAIVFSMVYVGAYYPMDALPVGIAESAIAVYPMYRILRKREKRAVAVGSAGCEAEDNKQFLDREDREKAIDIAFPKPKEKSED